MKDRLGPCPSNYLHTSQCTECIYALHAILHTCLF